MQTRCSFLVAFVLIFAVAGCSLPETVPQSEQNVVARSTIAAHKRHLGYKLIYSFPGNSGGISPWGGLTSVNGTMFGTTISGGDESACVGGCGTVFAGEQAIYAFKGLASKDGVAPNGDLLLVNTKLYGTTAAGGQIANPCSDNPAGQGCGTVFEVDQTGKERVIYRFKGGADGADPRAGLISLNGVLYGTTEYGGKGQCSSGSLFGGCGVIFAIDASGHEKVLHTFQGPPVDGASSEAALLAVNGELYGTTAFGGQCAFSNGCGTVFQVTPSGAESVIYSFQGGSDGIHPEAPLISVNGSLYGSTNEGGCNSACYSNVGVGVVFKLSSSGSEQIVHRFTGTPDGEFPSGHLIFEANKLYGTTLGGGANLRGTIFSIGSKGLKILYSFKGSPDGAIPSGLAIKGSTHSLNGTTQAGGSAGSYGGVGTIFRYLP